MDFSSFEGIVDKFTCSAPLSLQEERWNDALPSFKDYHLLPSMDSLPRMNGFLEEWEIYGAEGGNCYGDEAEHWSVDKTGEFGLFKLFLTALGNKITYQQSIDILGKVEKSEHQTVGFYGNYTCYEFQYIPLSVVYDWLKDCGLFSSGDLAINPKIL